jgi:hypothetical protein
MYVGLGEYAGVYGSKCISLLGKVCGLSPSNCGTLISDYRIKQYHNGIVCTLVRCKSLLRCAIIQYRTTKGWTARTRRTEQDGPLPGKECKGKTVRKGQPGQDGKVRKSLQKCFFITEAKFYFYPLFLSTQLNKFSKIIHVAY